MLADEQDAILLVEGEDPMARLAKCTTP